MLSLNNHKAIAKVIIKVMTNWVALDWKMAIILNQRIHGLYGITPNKKIDIDLSQYDIVIYDDVRPRYGIGELYKIVSRLGVPMIGSIHGGGRGYGSSDYNKGYEKAFDYLLVFGNMDVDIHDEGSKLIKMGIPSNDVLKEYSKSEDYILCEKLLRFQKITFF